MSRYQDTLCIRWLVSHDIPRVLEIEAQSELDNAWTWDEETLTNYISKKNMIGKVLEYNYQVVAFCVFDLQPKTIRLIKIATDAEVQRQGFASTLLRHIQEKINPQIRHTLHALVPAEALPAQLLLKKHGFIAATKRAYGRYMDIDLDVAIPMLYTTAIVSNLPVSHHYHPKNRCLGHFAP